MPTTSDRTAGMSLIFGAAHGVGAALARACLRRGERCVLGLPEDALSDVGDRELYYHDLEAACLGAAQGGAGSGAAYETCYTDSGDPDADVARAFQAAGTRPPRLVALAVGLDSNPQRAAMMRKLPASLLALEDPRLREQIISDIALAHAILAHAVLGGGKPATGAPVIRQRVLVVTPDPATRPDAPGIAAVSAIVDLAEADARARGVAIVHAALTPIAELAGAGLARNAARVEPIDALATHLVSIADAMDVPGVLNVHARLPVGA